MNIIAGCSLVFVMVFPPPAGQPRTQYQGADAILKALPAEPAPVETKQVDEETSGELDKITTDIKEFRKVSSSLAPEEAAARWLDIVDRFLKCPKQSLSRMQQTEPFGPYGFSVITAALPPPAAWDFMAKTLDARPIPDDESDAFNTHLLRLFTHKLTHQPDAMNKDMDALDALLDKFTDQGKKERMWGASSLEGQLIHESADATAAAKRLDRVIQQEGERQYFSVPDVVHLLGPQKAEEYLRKILVLKTTLILPYDNETNKLAAKLALEMIADLKAPQWRVACSPDATELFEAMQKRFPDRNESDYRDAHAYYLMSLIAAHRTAEAADFVKSTAKNMHDTIESDLDEKLERKGLGNDLANFYHDLLAENPDLPVWNNYVWIATKTGGQKKMVELAESSIKRSGLPEPRRELIEQHLRRAYLATGKVDEGIALLRAEIAREKKKLSDKRAARSSNNDSDNEDEEDTSDSDGEDYSEDVSLNTSIPNLGMELARIGEVLHRDDLQDEGIETVESWLKSKSVSAQGRYYMKYMKDLSIFLIELNRCPEAEELLQKALEGFCKKDRPGDEEVSQKHEILVLLMALYHHANRPADVVKLLDEAPQWGDKDLAGMLTEKVVIDRNPDYAGWFAADALAATGNAQDARRILEALLERRGDYDPGYELLIKLEPRDVALAKLDALYARDKFENRPLIWKAKLLLDAGRLPEAAATAQQAIEIDPSDGEHGPGRRMRVYSVLADIREAGGDKQGAETMRGVVTAIRHAEEADRFYNAGLTSRAATMYEESLTHFEDAYCIQSRLALRLAQIGDMAGAAEHYQRAYELMPASFGRVESHCFGCEGAFDGQQAQGIAEKVFSELAKAQPNNPRVHYLLAYLFMNEIRRDEALAEFQQAVKLDPEYLNAWNHILWLSQVQGRPADEIDSIQFTILRLDPLGRHSRFEMQKVSDLKAAWNALADIAKLQPGTPHALYPLQASSAKISAQEAATHRPARYRMPPDDEIFDDANRGRDDPARMISSQELLQNISQLIFTSTRMQK